jgi:hypothetical protein
MDRAPAFLLLFCLFTCNLAAQGLTSLSGTVLDPTGAVIPGATITVQQTATGAQRQTTADSSGRYSFPQLQPGRYKITAKAAGFADAVVNDVELLVNSPATVNVTFENVGAVAETVSVTAESIQVNTTDASLGNAISGRPITQLPFEARNIVGLLALQPGVTFLGDPNPGATPDYRSGAVNGGKSDQANVTLDGVDVNEQQNRYAFTSVLRVTLDSVQEFRTITTNAGAELGRGSGAQVALVTKSGTNEIHGSAYEFNRNTSTSANTFFNNSSGVPRPKLIRNVFGASIGGPIKKNRLFYFLNYEGRRDRSETPAVSTDPTAAGTKVVPTADFRQGIFHYERTDGSIGTLTPQDIQAIDPRHIGVNPDVLKILQTYPLPNDTSVGDNLNTAGFRFNAPTPLRWNTYIAKLDYQLDATGNHRVFWRGNLQNDNFQNGVPQFPGEPPNSVFLENSKGLAAGYTAVLRSNLISTFHYGFTRQGVEFTGTQTAGEVQLRDIEPRYSNARGTTRITPVHQFSDDLAWTRGAHNVSFGGVARFIRNRRVSSQNSFSDSLVNSAVLLSGGAEFPAAVPDAADTTAFREQFVNLLGLVTQVDAQYNYDLNGNVIPEGTPVRRNFAGEEYEMYVQDSWKVSRALTLTAGLRLSLFPPVYEANGYQTSANIPLGEWFDLRGGLAEQGKPQSLAPLISYQLASAPGGKPLYDYQKDWSPRFALAYSPQGDSGLSKFLFGGPGRTSIRAGWGMYYDLFGQGLIRSFDANALGFSSYLQAPASPSNPASNAETAPRFTGYYDLPRDIFPAAPAGGFPQTYPNVFAAINSIDQHLRSPYTMNMNFSIGREFGHGLFIQGSYIGRLSRHSLIRDDVAMPTNLKDPSSGMTYFDAAQALSKLGRAGADPASVKPIPFWENIFPGYADAGRTATQAIYQDYFLGDAVGGSLIGNESTSLQLLDLEGCSPCSRFGPNAFYNPQFASLSVFRSRGGGNYHAMQWSVRKRFAEGVSFDVNYTWSKSIDLQSNIEGDTNYNNGMIQNPWFPGQMKAVSDYDMTHLFSAFVVAELPFGKGKRFLNTSNGFINNILGGWQVSGIWRQSSGLPSGVQNGFAWPTNWQVAPWATQVGVVPPAQTTKNAPAAGAGGVPGPNIFTDPAAAVAAYDLTLPGETGQRNGVRGDGYFTIDVGLGKQFKLFTVKDHPHTLQFRAEAFNVTNSVRFDVGSINMTLGDPGNFGKYTDVLTRPRVMQFSARYEF